ncbi:hypothetical protein CMI41_00020 [Candidatus Pacearchaeota archaeon]|nr:hypothetical protein [Candidatus Pacearchaeota archaeon]|tara:strand:+ start:5857 stop:6438 length:582 start_codon:yes stop_codon:yes gene_type:complete
MRNFDPLTHKYSVDGLPYVGVNELLIAEGLKIDLKKVVPQEALEAGWDKGKTIHKIAQLTLKGTLDKKSVDPALTPYYDEIRHFTQEYGVSPVHIEAQMWDDDKLFAGQTDLIAKTNKGLAVVDWLISGEKYLQMLCYKMLAKKFFGLEIETLISVQLFEDKPYKPLFYKPQRKDELLIMSALNLYNYKKGRY